MKKRLLFALLFIGLNCFAQDVSKPNLPATTEKEYNFLTKGMRIQKESGLDIIDGYGLVNTERIPIDTKYLFTFSDLKEKSTGDLKGRSVVIKSAITSNTYYLCIPVNNKYYNDEYQKLINAFSIDIAKAYIKALSEKIGRG